MAEPLLRAIRRFDDWAVRYSNRLAPRGPWETKLRLAVLTLATFVAMC
jgi:hypothetical protein